MCLLIFKVVIERYVLITVILFVLLFVLLVSPCVSVLITSFVSFLQSLAMLIHFFRSSLISSILYREVVLNTNSFCLFVSWKVFLSLSITADRFAGCISLTWHLWLLKLEYIVIGSFSFQCFHWKVVTLMDFFLYMWLIFFFSCSFLYFFFMLFIHSICKGFWLLSSPVPSSFFLNISLYWTLVFKPCCLQIIQPYLYFSCVSLRHLFFLSLFSPSSLSYFIVSFLNLNFSWSL